MLPSSAPRCVPALRSLLARSRRVGAFLRVSLWVCLFPHFIPVGVPCRPDGTASSHQLDLLPIHFLPLPSQLTEINAYLLLGVIFFIVVPISMKVSSPYARM